MSTSSLLLSLGVNRSFELQSANLPTARDWLTGWTSIYLVSRPRGLETMTQRLVSRLRFVCLEQRTNAWLESLLAKPSRALFPRIKNKHQTRPAPNKKMREFFCAPLSYQHIYIYIYLFIYLWYPAMDPGLVCLTCICARVLRVVVFRFLHFVSNLGGCYMCI